MHENGCFEETELQALDPQQATKDAETITENTVRGKLSQSFGGKKSQVKAQDEVRRVFMIKYFAFHVITFLYSVLHNVFSICIG